MILLQQQTKQSWGYSRNTIISLKRGIPFYKDSIDPGKK